MPAHSANLLGSELTPQEATFVRLVATEGYTIADAAAHTEVGISRATAYNWAKAERIQIAVREILSETRTLNRMKARSLMSKAWATIEKAMGNPNMTPTQLKAAALVLMHANGDERLTNDTPVIHVEVNTQLNNNTLAEQQARHTQPARVYEGGYTVIEDE